MTRCDPSQTTTDN